MEFSLAAKRSVTWCAWTGSSVGTTNGFESCNTHQIRVDQKYKFDSENSHINWNVIFDHGIQGCPCRFRRFLIYLLVDLQVLQILHLDHLVVRHHHPLHLWTIPSWWIPTKNHFSISRPFSRLVFLGRRRWCDPRVVFLTHCMQIYIDNNWWWLITIIFILFLFLFYFHFLLLRTWRRHAISTSALSLRHDEGWCRQGCYL